MPEVLGQGAYGAVVLKDGKAVKTFHKLNHLVQEWIAGFYLKDCDCIIRHSDFDVSRLELSMELYDTSLSKALDKGRLTEGDKWTAMKDILKGLIEIHTRGLAHGDIKPGNILVRFHPSFKAVLGDLGFVSLTKYAKVERTAARYRELNIKQRTSHDIYSLGILMIEMFGSIDINSQLDYKDASRVASDAIKNPRLLSIIIRMINSEHYQRPSAQEIYKFLFGTHYSPTNGSSSSGSFTTDLRIEDLHGWMKNKAAKYKISGYKRGYQALMTYISKREIGKEWYTRYANVFLYIISSIYGKSGYKLRPKNYGLLCKVMTDESAISVLLSS